MESTDVFSGFQDFLERMRQPSAADFVKSIKSFIVSFSNHSPDPERDSAAVQEFLANMEAAFRAHLLWAGCSEEELESAGEGLEKYVMTKLFTRVFASLPDDVKHDEQLFEKMTLVQQFIRPENLDIKANFMNETSLLLAQKELQKINMYKAPRDKLVCILNCCKVINNLLLNAAIASNEDPPGADEFLPVLICVTIKANPPQLHSNLLYIQRYRSRSRLVGETSYFFTNMLSAESFMLNIDAKTLSMEEGEFERDMESARALLSGLSADMDGVSNQTDQAAEPVSREEPAAKPQISNYKKKGPKEAIHTKDQSSIAKIPSISELENEGAAMFLKDDQTTKVFKEYPYSFAQTGDLTLSDVEDLLNNYKQLVFRYICLSKGLGANAPAAPLTNSQWQSQEHADAVKEHLDSEMLHQKISPWKDTTQADVGSENVHNEGDSDFLITKDEEMTPKKDQSDETVP